jgi:CRISPR/Cas system-associated exonuclease Cas4 (RecB family)
MPRPKSSEPKKPKAAKSRKKLYEPGGTEPYPLSRSKIDLFLNCPRCFCLDQRHGVGRVSGPPFTINSAIDGLLKREFDVHREAGTVPRVLADAGLDYVPFKHDKIDDWRNFRRGVRALHPATNFDVYGALDDVWQDPATGEIIVADYKATAKASDVGIDADWQISYKRQVELYQWLLSGNGFEVSETAWFVYANGDVSAQAFGARMDFKISLIPYAGDTTWVEPTLRKIKETLEADPPPKAPEECTWCAYRKKARDYTDKK